MQNVYKLISVILQAMAPLLAIESNIPQYSAMQGRFIIILQNGINQNYVYKDCFKCSFTFQLIHSKN